MARHSVHISTIDRRTASRNIKYLKNISPRSSNWENIHLMDSRWNSYSGGIIHTISTYKSGRTKFWCNYACSRVVDYWKNGEFRVRENFMMYTGLFVLVKLKLNSLVWRSRRIAPEDYQKFQKIQGNFYFLNTVLEEQFCVGCADTKFHTIFHHWK